MMTDYEKQLISVIRSSMLKAVLYECAISLAAAFLIGLLLNYSRSWIYGVGLCVFMIVYGAFYTKSSTDVIAKNAPVECEVYDLLIIGQRSKYELSAILRNIVTGELYYTFGKYDLSLMPKARAKKPGLLSEMKIYHNDMSEVQVGDSAFIYIKRFFDPKLHIEPNDDHYFLDGSNHLFRNTVPEHDISVMNEVKFFEGYVDVR